MGRTDRRTLGRRAEEYAFRHLIRHGLTPVTRNFRTRLGEIDLVMLDGDCLAFVEVRYRSARAFVDASLTVDARKQRKLGAAAELFLARNAVFRHHPCRFDVVGVDRGDDGGVSLDWVRDAFRPGD